MKQCLGVLHLFSGERSSIFVLSKVNSRGNVILPVSECTSVLRTLVLPGILEYLVDSGEGAVSSWVNGEVSLVVIQ